jgi:hypothetical protein
VRCLTCNQPLEQAKTGRPRKYCSRRCKRKAARERVASFGPLRRVSAPPEQPQPVPAAALPEQKRPSTEVLQAQATRAERAAALGRAAAKVARCEEELAAARAARAALRPELDPEPHRYATYGGIEEMRAAHGGAVFNPGIDTNETAQAYRQQAEGEQG